MLRGRLGIDSAKVPHKDRAGLLYLARGALTARDGARLYAAPPLIPDRSGPARAQALGRR